ncbi:MAG: hypothetical protein HYX53_09270 [Chloroflexi bacterium]|nr:hypothetical protein [Chloroflexota bacterium]
MTTNVQVLASSDALRQGLVRQLRDQPGLAVTGGEPRSAAATRDVLVMPVADCPLARCAELTGAGTRLILLASLPSPREFEAYRRAGAAAYIAMTPGSPDLLSAIRSIAASGVPTWVPEDGLNAGRRIPAHGSAIE